MASNLTNDLSLDVYLGAWAKSDAVRQPVAATVAALADACKDIAALIAAGPLEGQFSQLRNDKAGGDFQTELDILANAHLIDALRTAPVAAVASEELDVPVALNPDAPILVALDPLDGSSNIDTNVSVGTIFSLLPTPPSGGNEPAAFLRPGREQVAAGYVLYGPQTALVLTLGEGTDMFTLDRKRGIFVRTRAQMRVPSTSKEFAINASNYRHWSASVRVWFDDCIAGSEGPRGRDFNMRWIASMVAEAHRILTRGGVYIYPGDAREGYHSGRLRLVYEGNPIAFLMEQAGAAASTGSERILERTPRILHERVPLIFGSREEVEWLERHHIEPHLVGEQSPLFGRRGLFRA
jgi:fructose-1,6-bisphosphatase I